MRIDLFKELAGRCEGRSFQTNCLEHEAQYVEHGLIVIDNAHSDVKL